MTPAWALTFYVTDLGTLGGDATAARALNNVGQIVCNTAAGASWIWSATTGLQQISTLYPSGAAGINDAGVVVSTARYTSTATFAYRWTADEGMHQVNLGSANASASGMNAAGQISGTRNIGVQLLGTIARDSRATGINELSQVVG